MKHRIYKSKKLRKRGTGTGGQHKKRGMARRKSRGCAAGRRERNPPSRRRKKGDVEPCHALEGGHC